MNCVIGRFRLDTKTLFQSIRIFHLEDTAHYFMKPVERFDQHINYDEIINMTYHDYGSPFKDTRRCFPSFQSIFSKCSESSLLHVCAESQKPYRLQHTGMNLWRLVLQFIRVLEMQRPLEYCGLRSGMRFQSRRVSHAKYVEWIGIMSISARYDQRMWKIRRYHE